MSVDASNLTWHIINAIKELSAQVTSLQNQITTLQGK
jgi:conjugal transfer/entry exclusion protein